MAENAFSKEEVVFFEQVLEGFDPNNITARQVSKYMAPPMGFERSAMTVHRPVPYIAVPSTGMTIATFNEKTQLSVPSLLNLTTHVINNEFKMNAAQLNDPNQRNMIARAGVRSLSAKMDNVIANKIAKQGTLFIGNTAALSKYDDYAAAEAKMTVRDVPIESPRTLIMNANDWNRVAGDLANRGAPPTGMSKNAFERSMVPSIGGFDTFKASFMPNLVAAAGTGWLVNGAQSHAPVATDGNGNNVDNRYMNLVVDTGAGTVKEGDAFTIAGVNALSMIHKNDTGELQVFRVIERVDATNWTVSPAIITNAGSPSQAQKDYANCSAAAPDNAAITFINPANALANIFFVNEAVEIIHGQLSDIDLNGAGVATMVESTDSGIQILFAKGAKVSTLETEYRLTMWADATILNEQMCGVLLGLQV